MCNLYLEGNRAIVDLSKCPYEFASPEFINLHLKDLATQEVPIKTIRYEEEIVIELNEAETSVLIEYAGVVKQVELLLLREEIYGLKQDPQYDARRKIIRRFYENMLINPLIAERELGDYKEEPPERSAFVQGHQLFKAWISGILKRFTVTKLHQLVKKTGDFRLAFLSLTGLKSLYFVSSIVLSLPPGATPMKGAEAKYALPFDVNVQVYEVEDAEAPLYVQKNEIIENLKPELQGMLKSLINEQVKENFENTDWEIIMDLKTREYRSTFIDQAVLKGIAITPKEALAMGREAAAWVVGAGAFIENLALDKENVTDIFVDSENSPIYIEHARFGLCHTLYRYNRDLLERSFRNIVYTTKAIKKFDDANPFLDTVVKRLNMRCSLQRPPATFEELKGALRIMKDQPFTYPQYINLKSLSPFYAGYDDVLVGLGCSEAVLGLKAVGKTMFTAAKISAIGTRKRILPIQDIEEIPVKAFRKRGFHIGAARVRGAGREEVQTNELDLVTMANVLLRMGDSALIINEVRSRSAVQGIINLLNTQPGVFLLYNLHAESLKDVQDRLELVFGIPSASMFATDRYTFLKKLRFGRRGRVYRVLGYEYQSDSEQKKFVETFRFKRGEDIARCNLECKFLRNPEASMQDFDKVDIGKLAKDLDIAFIPPALAKRSEETGIAPEQYIMQAFFKAKIYYDIYKASIAANDKLLLELDFVLKVNSNANKLISSLEKENGEVDFKDAWKKWEPVFKDILKVDIEARRLRDVASSTSKIEKTPAKK